MKKLVCIVVSVMLLGSVASAELLSNWTFDADWTESVSGYDMTPISYGAAGAVPVIDAGGKIGGAALFDRTQQQYAQATFPASALFAADSSYTIAGWYKTFTADLPDTYAGREMIWEAGPNYPTSYALRDRGAGDAGEVYVDTDSSANFFILTGDAAGADVWHHIAITYDVGTNVVSTYLDGVADSTITAVGTLDPATWLNVGAHHDSNKNWLNGMVDDLGVWNQVLPAGALADLAGGTAAADVVPEPATLSLLGLGCLGLLRKRK